MFAQEVVDRGIGLAGLQGSGAGFRDSQQGVAQGHRFAGFDGAESRQHARLAPGHGRQVGVVAGHQPVAAKMPVNVVRQGLDRR